MRTLEGIVRIGYRPSSAFPHLRPAKRPIPLGEVLTRIKLWHAERDPLVGNMRFIWLGNFPMQSCTCSRARAHLWILDHMAEVLEALLDP